MNGARSTTTGTSDTNLATIPALALRPKSAAKALGIGQRKLWELTKAGKIPCVRLGTCVIYPRALLEAWLATQATQAEREHAPKHNASGGGVAG